MNLKLADFRTYQLAVHFFRATKTSGDQLPCHLKDQFRRAASSVALNLAEGSGRVAKNDQLRFFHIAMGSIREVQAVVELSAEQFSTAEKDQLDHLAASAFKLIRVASQ